LPTALPSIPNADLAQAAAFRSQLRHFLRRADSVTRQAGLTAQRYDLLLMIRSADQTGQGVRLTDLHDLMHLKQPAVTELVKRTEQAGLIDRRPSPHDGRSSLLRLTREGERRLAIALEGLRDDRQALIAALAELDKRFRPETD
jgi:DNA-binding MarR family transcriptional regulator